MSAVEPDESNPYTWTGAELEAALKAFNAAPATATKAELRQLMINARRSVAV